MAPSPPSEIPNSQASSPGLGSSSSDDADSNNQYIAVAELIGPTSLSTTNLSPSEGNRESADPHPPSKIPPEPATLDSESSCAAATVSNPTPHHTHPPETPLLQHATPSKPLSTGTARNPPFRPSSITSHNHPHLASRIAQLTTTLDSTQTALASILAEFEALPDFTSSAKSTSTSSSAAPPPQTQLRPPDPNLTLSPIQTATLHRAHRILDAHVQALSRYNAVRDAGLALLGFVAERRGVTVGSVMEEMGVEEGD
ncbi:uncharacterized protein HMPREF1541_05190 [Cyphellophora europaea CBS 101466]|uniref:Swi5-domain-containing protein n=1 Tax=Cyphellophora europaea (strain CBS 101466) TaxID=1220924 RepID=W2RX81_CYPE1|nr:uncharacterized protein HMPREF1541_05190 [Cyphellophora europaea CBS 101466]ETN40910.1 hypothetical protein HMPREF1541_05190 [Cyphellophora europaea CBS 101466]